MSTFNLNYSYLKNTLLILVMLLGITTINANYTTENYSSLVIVKVDGLNGDTYSKITKGINKTAALTLEYSCLQSDVIVIKYKHTFSEKGDVQHFINNKMKKWAKGVKVEFIYIDMVLGGSSKC